MSNTQHIKFNLSLPKNVTFNFKAEEDLEISINHLMTHYVDKQDNETDTVKNISNLQVE